MLGFQELERDEFEWERDKVRNAGDVAVKRIKRIWLLMVSL
jgi:hypothetical protein